jgi:hypothetical protein
MLEPLALPLVTPLAPAEPVVVPLPADAPLVEPLIEGVVEPLPAPATFALAAPVVVEPVLSPALTTRVVPEPLSVTTPVVDPPFVPELPLAAPLTRPPQEITGHDPGTPEEEGTKRSEDQKGGNARRRDSVDVQEGAAWSQRVSSWTDRCDKSSATSNHVSGRGYGPTEAEGRR